MHNAGRRRYRLPSGTLGGQPSCSPVYKSFPGSPAEAAAGWTQVCSALRYGKALYLADARNTSASRSRRRADQRCRTTSDLVGTHSYHRDYGMLTFTAVLQGLPRYRNIPIHPTAVSRSESAHLGHNATNIESTTSYCDVHEMFLNNLFALQLSFLRRPLPVCLYPALP